MPHSPFQAPESYFRDLPDNTKAAYAMVSSLDENIGRLMAGMDRLGLAENTIVIFLADNGPNGQRFNAGLRAAKGSVYEGGVRVPFFLRWPARLAPGRRIDTIAAHIDVYLTVLERCGAARPKGLPIDGVRLVPLVEGKTRDWPDRMIFTHREAEKNPSATYPGAVRTQRFNLVNGTDLYEIPKDPGEQHNVSAKYPEVVQRLRGAYEAWYSEAARQCGLGRLPIPVGYAEENPVVLPAPQSDFTGGLRFYGGPGWAHDWVTGWTSAEDRVEWNIDVIRDGAYEVSLRYLCPKEDVGSKVAVAAGGKTLAAAITEPTSMTRKPSRAIIPEKGYPEMHWATLRMGRLNLGRGLTRLTVKALQKAGATVMELKEVVLERVG